MGKIIRKSKSVRQSGILYLQIRVILLGRFISSLQAYVFPNSLSYSELTSIFYFNPKFSYFKSST